MSGRAWQEAGRTPRESQDRRREAKQARTMARDPLRGPIPRPPGTPMSDDRCVCGHRDEPDHEDTWVAPCVVKGCRCLAFDPAPIQEDST